MAIGRPPRTLYWFSYHAPLELDLGGRKHRRVYLHKVRDGAAFCSLQTALHGMRFEFGDLILNVPHALGADGAEPEQPIDSMEKWSWLGSDCVLVLPTRPPIDDFRHTAKKRVHRSYTWLDFQVINSIRPLFRHCSRTRISLSDATQGELREHARDRSELEFLQYEDFAWYKRVGTKKVPGDARERTTAGYIVWRPSLWREGPSLLAVFGMSGNDTMVWASLLPQRFPTLLKEVTSSKTPRFLMAELRAPERIDLRPRSDAIQKLTNGWSAELLLDTRL